MKVKVAVFSRAGTQSLHTLSLGELTVADGGFTVQYRTDGDDCRLEYSDGELIQRRSGRLTFVMNFREGDKTECVLSESGRKFVFPVFTAALGATLRPDGCTVTISYVQGEEAEPTELIFTAEKIKERDGKRTPRPKQ